MADSPPPLDNVDIDDAEEAEASEEPSYKPEEPSSKPEPEPDEEPLFAETEPEVPKVEQQPEPFTTFPAPTLEATAVEESPEPVVKPKGVESATSKPLDLFGEDEDKMEDEVWLG